MQLGEGIRLWLGAKGSPATRRALYFGAGLTKATDKRAPLFGAYAKQLLTLLRARELPVEFRKALDGLKDDDEASSQLMDLIEMLDLNVGRVEVARQFINEPPGGDDAKDTYRSFKDLFEGFEGTVADGSLKARGLGWLTPGSPNMIVARFVAEGDVDDVLTTNWDAYLEFGAAVSGIFVEDADDGWHSERKVRWLPDDPITLRVIETPDEMNLHWAPPGPGMPLYKLHGGVRSVRRALGDADRGIREAEERLRRSFVVANSDLIQWRDATQWVAERVGSTLRSSAVFSIGVSGADTVVYDTFRRHIHDWECAATRARETRALSPARDAQSIHIECPRFVTVTAKPSLKLRNMMSVRHHRDRVGSHSVAAGGAHALRALYARWMLDMLIGKDHDEPDAIALDARMELDIRAIEVQNPYDEPEPGKTLLIDLLTLAIGPNARWAAMVARRRPFSEKMGEARAGIASWWYAPWRGAEPERLRTIRRAVVALLQDQQIGVIDAMTGVVTPPNATGEGMLLLPWPWADPGEKPSVDVLREMLLQHFPPLMKARGKGAPRTVRGRLIAWPDLGSGDAIEITMVGTRITIEAGGAG